MEHLSIVLTNYIFKKGIIDEKNYEIYQYGFQCFLEVSASTICSIVIALLLHMFSECLFFFLLFIPMRSFSGGLHLKTYFSCFIGSCLILTTTLLIVKYLTIPIPISFMLYVFCAIIILIIGPVDHPNREVDSQENRIFTRRTHFTLLFSFLLAVIFAITGNTRYLFLQAIVFAFICITSFIGHISYKQS